MAEMDDWNWRTAVDATVSVTAQDARFILAACCQWLPDGDIERITQWDASDYEHAPVLRLVKKTLPLLTTETANAEGMIDLSVGEISYILHFLRGDDSYGGGAKFEKALLKALHDLLKGGA